VTCKKLTCEKLAESGSGRQMAAADASSVQMWDRVFAIAACPYRLETAWGCLVQILGHTGWQLQPGVRCLLVMVHQE
jgi:hypothetical protein